jgi:hypothetical protein
VQAVCKRSLSIVGLILQNTRVDPNLPAIRVKQHVDKQRWKDIVKERLLGDKKSKFRIFYWYLTPKEVILVINRLG